MERNNKICVVRTTAKMLNWCNIWPFYYDFSGLKLSSIFYINDYFIRNKIGKEKLTYVDGLL